MVLLCEPLLADVLACLLSLVLVLQQYTKQEVCVSDLCVLLFMLIHNQWFIFQSA